MQNKIKELIEKITTLPDELFVGSRPSYSKEQQGKYRVLWLLDRQKPSVEASYDFDEERFGITRDGKIIWGYDSGCSCPAPFEADEYHVKEYKEFILDKFPDFDTDYEKEIVAKIDEVLNVKGD